jgi:hypothetical protein
VPARWLFVVLLAAIAVHAVDLYQFESFEFDKVNHVTATRSWLDGRGFTIPDVAPAGPPNAVRRPLLGFLPGYAFALAPLMRLTDDVWWSTYVLDVFAQSLFLIAWAGLLRAATGSWGPAAALLFIWTVLYSPAAEGTYSNMLALSVFTAAVAAGALAVSERRSLAWTGGVVSAACMACACAVRYAYWPLIVVVPVALVLAKRDVTRWTLAGIHAVAAGGMSLATAVFMQRTTGEAVFLTRWYPAQGRGVFWSHLLMLNPFPADALGINRVYALVAKDNAGMLNLAPEILWVLSALCAAVAAGYLTSRARSWIAGELDSHETFFVAAGVVTCAATVAMNVWLTLRLPAVADGWTVGAEPRYYLPTLPFLGASVWLVARDRSLRMPRLRRLAIALLAGALIVTGPVRLVRLKRYFGKNIATAWMASGRRAQADVLFAAIRAVDAGGAPPLFVDDSLTWRRYVATMGGALAINHARLKRCAGDGASLNFLVTEPLASTRHVAGTRLGAVEDVQIVSVVGSPCEPAAAGH